jgi:hypothetical protein
MRYPIYIKYKERKIAPSILVISPLFPMKNKNIINNTIANNSIQISIIRVSVTGKFDIDQVIPKTKRILKILLQTIFPIAISDCFFSDATIDVTSSGADVPKATIVRPIIDSGTSNESAIFLAEPTRKSAQTHNHTSHRATNNNDLLTLCPHSTFSISTLPLFAKPKVYTKNMMKNNRNIRLSPLSKIFSPAHEKNVSNARKNKATDAISEKGTSL